MAERLIEQWRLAVLRVRLDLAARTPMVASELTAFPGDVQRVLFHRHDSLESFGIDGAGTDMAATPVLPRGLAEAVVQTMSGELQGEAALWLRLVPPYGVLGAVHWEELVPALGVPLLRVPDRLPTPVDFGSTWTVAVAASAPRGQTWAADHVSNFVGRLRDELTVPIGVDVFADAGSYDLMAGDASLLGKSDVRLHLPADARGVSRTRQSSGETQFRGPAGRAHAHPSQLVWADWIADGLAGRAVRALHVVSEGHLDGDRPLITVNRDPGRLGKHPKLLTIGADDISTLADVLGATLVSFGSPRGGGSDMAIRMIADEVGQTRPGPTLYSSLEHDADSVALAGGHAFVARAQQHAHVPQHPSLFTYVQPECVVDDEILLWPDDASGVVYADTFHGEAPHPDSWWTSATSNPFHDEIAHLVGDRETVPAWVASTSRFIDTRRAEIAHVADTSGETLSSKQAYDDGVATALEAIQQMVLRHTRGS